MSILVARNNTKFRLVNFDW